MSDQLNQKDDRRPAENMADVDATAVVSVSQDGLTAYLSITPPAGQGGAVTLEALKAALEAAEIRRGVDEAVVALAAREQSYGKRYTVARGLPPIEGQDGSLDYLFNVAEKSSKPKLREDGTVDFYDLRVFEPATAGQQLVAAYPAKPGADGYDVYGRPIAHRAAKPAPMILGGKNTKVIGDNESLVAECDGRVVFDGKKVAVSSVLEIHGDIGMETGNIDFKGDIVIDGNVMTGFSVTAKGMIEVFGLVEGAFVKAGGDIKIRGGIHGSEKAEIIAGGNLSAKFIESATVSSDGDIHANNILHSDVSCAGSIVLKSGRAMIAGGNLNAGKSIIAKTVGSTMATVTEINIGTLPKVLEKYKESKELYEKYKAEYDKLTHVCDIMLKLKEKNQLSDEKKDVFLKAMHSKVFLRGQLSKLKKETDDLMSPWMDANDGVLCASDVVHAGVRVTIGNAMIYVRDDIPACRLKNEDGMIMIGSYTGG